MVPRLNVWGWGPVDVNIVTSGEAALDEVAVGWVVVDEAAVDGAAVDGAAVDETAVDETAADEVVVCCRIRFAYSALVSTVGKAGQVIQAKYRRAAPKAVVAVSRSLSDVSVWMWSFASACHVANM